jgi:hypothetical protein
MGKTFPPSTFLAKIRTTLITEAYIIVSAPIRLLLTWLILKKTYGSDIIVSW